MKLRAIAFAVPLVLGAACAHGSSQSAGASTGAASADGQGQSQGGQVAGTEQPQQPSSTGAQAPGSAGAGTSSSPSSSDAQAAGRAAQDPIMHPGPPVKAHAEDQVVRGVISDVSEDTVSIESDLGVTRTLTIVPQTTIRVNGEDASYDDLSEGQPVRAAFSDVEGEDVAVEIRAGELGAPSEPATPPDAGSSPHSPGPSGSTGSGSPSESGTGTGTRGW